ncbi:MAG: iron-containing alcohol dehydrogenase [Thermoguttaceae bacterium]|nr:iron-containing alcohol dehydrogenase [Thermoguttaceae bacterium]MBR4103047.1 iron-containing alcohol dehydrogenase [Thermoguttaceae bacterium]
MNFFKSACCRIYQTAFRLALPILPYREPEIVPTCAALDGVFLKENVKKVLIVADQGVRNAGLLAPIEATLTKSGVSYVVYDKTRPNPTVENVEEALKVYRDNGCDALIAVGGGSPIDCAKAVGARVVYPKKSVGKLKGLLRVWRRLPPLIAVPTTAGTGSETTVAAVIVDAVKHHKYAILSFPLIPTYAVLDPELTFSLPPGLTATTGIDALVHAVEAYIGRSTTKETRRLALDATKLIFENLEIAFNDGRNRDAREKMLRAAHMAGLAFSKSYVGYIHAIAHTLGGRYGTPHGLANAVITPYALDFYGEKAWRKLRDLAVASGVATLQDDAKTAAEKMIAAIRNLNAKLGIPEKLAGIKKEDIPAMARLASKEANPLYPVPKLLDAKELERFYYCVADWSDER